MQDTKFRMAFHAAHEQYAERSGQPFRVVRTITEPDETHDREVLPMYEIEFSDGEIIEAWPEEVEAPMTLWRWGGQCWDEWTSDATEQDLTECRDTHGDPADFWVLAVEAPTEAPAGALKLWKSTIVIWTQHDPKDLEIEDLAREAESGDAYCSRMEAAEVADARIDPDWDFSEFFGSALAERAGAVCTVCDLSLALCRCGGKAPHLAVVPAAITCGQCGLYAELCRCGQSPGLKE